MVLETSTTILSSPLFLQGILPFLLVFVLVFAVLQKSKILGAETKQVSALIALVIGLITISFSYYTDIIVRMVPILAVGLVIILIFLMLWGIVFVGDTKFEVAGWVRWVFGGMAFVAILVASFIITGAWDYFKNYFATSGSGFLTNVVFIVLAIVAVGVVIGFGGSSSGGSSSGKKEH